MIISTIIFISLIGKMQYLLLTKNTINIFNDKNAYYFTPAIYYDFNKFDLDYILSESINSNYSIGEIYNLYIKGENANMQYAYGYNDAIIEYADITLTNGKWFETDKKYNKIPVIAIGNNYKVNDLIYFTSESGGLLEAEVIGTINKNDYLLTFYSSGSKDNASLNNLVTPASGNFIVPYNSNSIPSIHQEDTLFSHIQYGNIIIFNEQSINQEVYSLLNEYGEVSSINAMKSNYSNEIHDFFISNSIILLIFSMLTLTGIGGVNSMVSIENERRYTILFMNGFTNKRCAVTEVIRMGILILISFLTVMILYYNFAPLKKMLSFGEYRINFITFLLVLLYMILIFSIGSISFILKLSRQDLISIYKKKA